MENQQSRPQIQPVDKRLVSEVLTFYLQVWEPQTLKRNEDSGFRLLLDCAGCR